MTRVSTLLFLMLAAFCCLNGYAQTPANDECANAIGLNVSAGMLCQTSTNGTSTGATTSTTVGQPDCSGGSIDDDVWYKFTATNDQHIITVTGSGPMYFPRFEAYSGTCGNLTSLGVCATAANSTAEGLVTGLTAGETYYVRVYSNSTNAGYKGAFSICVTSFTNDECSGAISLTPGSTCNVTYGSNRFSTASTTTGQPLCGSHTGWSDDDVWYKFTTPATPASSYTVTVNGSSFTSGTALTSPQMTIYTGSCGSLSPISSACTNPLSGACVYVQNATPSGLLPNTTYFIRLYSWATPASYRGQFNICVTSGTGGTPQLSVNPSTLNFGSLCVGDSSTLSFTVTGTQLSSGNLSVGPLAGYQFSTDNSTFSSTASITSCGGSLSQIVYVKFKPTAGQTYNGSIPVSGGGASTVSVSVIAAGSAGIPASLPDAVSNQDTLCAGNNATLSIQSGNLNSASSWQWYTGSCGGPAVGSGAFISVSPANSTTYYVRGVGNCVASGACDSVRITVTNGASPAILISANPAGTACVGSPITFTATPSNGGNSPAYQWRINGVSQGTGTATFTSSALNNGDVVTCQLTSSALCAVPTSAVSNSISVSLIPSVQPTISISSNQSGTVCAGTNITFTAQATQGGANPVYQWKVNGNNFGINTSSFTSGSLSNGDVVSCVLTSNASCATPAQVVSNSITVTISPTITPSVTVSSGTGGNICQGNPASFTATPTNGGNNPVYNWLVNGVSQNVNNVTFTSSALVNGDVVICQLTSNATCAAPQTAGSSPITVTVVQSLLPTIAIQANTPGSFCQGAAISFTATITNGGSTPVFNWTVNGVSQQANSATFSSSSLTNGDIVSCQLTSNAACANPQTITSQGVTVSITPSVQPQISIIPDVTGTICAGTTTTFTASSANEGSNPVYQWQVNGVSTGNNSSIFSTATLSNGDVVQCTLTSNANCAVPSQVVSNSFTASVSQPATPSVVLTSSAIGSVCPGTVITITATPFQGGNNPTYQWSLNGAATGSNSPSFSSSQLTNGDVVSCQMTSSSTCITSNTATSNAINVVISDVVIPQVSISAVPSAVICQGSLATFAALPNGGGNNPLFDWLVNGISTGTQSATFSSANLNPNDQISCRLVSSEPCANPQSTISNTITVTVNEVNTTISLTNGGNSLTASQTSAQYQWISCPDFSWIPGENNISFSPSTPGSYACIITQNNCTDTSECLSVIPTTIAPIALSQAFLVYPSPTQDNVFIHKNTNELIELTVTDITGREMTHMTLTQRNTSLSLRHLLREEGLYFFTFRTANNLVVRRVLFTR